MTTYERRQLILDALRKQPNSSVVEMAKLFEVSQGTIRNDLNVLEEEGRLTRTHGGAILKTSIDINNTSFTDRHKENSDLKEQIAKQAAKMVDDSDAIFLDASSTAFYLGLCLESKRRLRVVTNGLDVARLMAKNPTNTVVLIGGILNADGSSVTGLFSEHLIQELRIQKAFVSCSGFSMERGLTETHLQEAILKRKVIDSANQVIALLDSTKFGKEDLTSFASVNQIAYIFTDKGISEDWIKKVKNAKINIVLSHE